MATLAEPENEFVEIGWRYSSAIHGAAGSRSPHRSVENADAMELVDGETKCSDRDVHRNCELVAAGRLVERIQNEGVVSLGVQLTSRERIGVSARIRDCDHSIWVANADSYEQEIARRGGARERERTTNYGSTIQASALHKTNRRGALLPKQSLRKVQ